MTISEFHSAAMAAIASDPGELVLKELIIQAGELSDMVGWAEGIIDKDGQVSEAFIHLQAQARLRHEATGDENIAILHDAVGVMLAVIYQHDEDLTPSTDNDGDSITPQA